MPRAPRRAAALLGAAAGARAGPCADALRRLCLAARDRSVPACDSCVITAQAELTAAGCAPAAEIAWCAVGPPTPTPPTPVPPPAPPPNASCVEWRWDTSGDPPAKLIVGKQCDNPRDCTVGSIDLGLCIPQSGSGYGAAGHIDLPPPSSDSRGCVWNDGSGQHVNEEEIWYAGGGGPAWVLTKEGYVAPQGALRSGTGHVVARTLPANTNHGNVIPGFVAVAANGSLGTLQFDDYGTATHLSVDYSAQDYELACCGDEAACTPTPPTPGPTPDKNPWIRFAHTSPTDVHVDCVVTVQNRSLEFLDFSFGHFSNWQEAIGSDNGQVDIYQRGSSGRGALLVSATYFLPPGPVLVVLKDAFPPKGATSVEIIANSFPPAPAGKAELRLFNLSPDTAAADMDREAAPVAAGVRYSVGSDWFPMPAAPAQFAVRDAATNASLATPQLTPPAGAASLFLIGLQAAPSPGLRAQVVLLVDSH